MTTANANVSLSALRPSLEAAYDCHLIMGSDAEQASYLQWMFKDEYSILKEAWSLLGDGNESLISFAEGIRNV